MSKLREALSLVDNHINKLVQEKLGETPILRTKTDQGETFVITREQLKYLVRNSVNAIQEKCKPEKVKEQNKVKIKVKHPGTLQVPEGKTVNQLSYNHFLSVARKRGFPAVIRALNNINVWNRTKNPKLSNWADRMQNRISVAYEKTKK